VSTRRVRGEKELTYSTANTEQTLAAVGKCLPCDRQCPEHAFERESFAALLCWPPVRI